MKICKNDKSLVRFDRNKVIKTCMAAGAPLKLATRIASEVRKEGYEGMTTDEIRMRVYIKLKKINVDFAQRYVYRSNMRVRTSTVSLDYFDAERIVKSLTKETRVDKSFAEKIAKEVEKDLGNLRLDYVTAPLIREIVNVKLLEHGMESVRARYTRLGMPVYDVKVLLEEGSKDMAQYSPEAAHKRMSDQIAREYALVNVLPVDLADAQMSAQIHIHDLNYFALRPTTFSHDVRYFLKKGVKVDGTGEYTAVAGPAKNAQQAFRHAVRAMIAGQTECSREQLIENLNYVLAPYVEGLSYDDVKRLVRDFFYEIYQTSVGKGGQAIYADISLDWSTPDHLKEVQAILPYGKNTHTDTYSDYVEEAHSILDAVLDVACEGDYIGKPFMYPKIRLNVEGADDEVIHKAAMLSESFGLPYYSKKSSFYGVRRGTIQHVSINLPQLGYKGKDVMRNLDNRMKKAFEVHLLKKKVIASNMEHNLLPFLKQRVKRSRYYNHGKQLHVISYAGLADLTKQQTGYDMKSAEGMGFAEKIIHAMMDSIKGFKKESELDFVLSGSPKGACHSRFAQIDAYRFRDKSGLDPWSAPYYWKTHQVHPSRLAEKLRLEGKIAAHINGRSVSHIRLGPHDYGEEEVAKLIKRTYRRDDVNFFTLSRDLSVCSRCGRVTKQIESKCPGCKISNVGLWSRDAGHVSNMVTWTPSQLRCYLQEARYDPSGNAVELPRKQVRIVESMMKR